jgi:Tol biopolymer transport system component
MRLELLIVLVFGVSFGIWGANVCAGAEPSYTIAFASFGPRNTDLFVADADGKNAKPLVPHGENDYNASFSADGNWVVFTSHRKGSADLYRVRPDGTELERLTEDPAFDDQAALSPDGTQLAFVSNRGGPANLWLLDLASKKVSRLTEHDHGDFRPAWSPDGEWIAFSSDRDSTKSDVVRGFVTRHSTEVYLIRPDGSGLRRVTRAQAFAGSPTWSRDGKTLVIFEAELAEVANIVAIRRLRGTTQVATIDVATGERRVLTSGAGEKWSPRWVTEDRVSYVSGGPDGGIEFTKGPAGARGVFGSPGWSKDGRHLVFHRDVEPDWSTTPRASQGRDPRFRLVRTGVFPSYSPSGDRLVCNSQPGGIHHNSIVVMNSDGSNRLVVFEDAGKSAVAPVWSPKPEKIAFGFGQFFQAQQGPAIADIAVIGADGKGLKVLTDGKGNNGFPSWSPDGRRLVYRSSDGKTGGLFILDVETGESKELKTGTTMANFPAWSPTEDLIAFTTYQDGDYEICAIKSDGTGFKRLTHSPGNDAHCAWSPDGEWIAFTSARGGFQDEAPLHPYNPQQYGKIHVMRADGSDVRRLTDDAYEHGTVAFVPLPEAKSGPR